MTSIQLFACIGMVTGFFILLRLSPMEFTDGVFRSLTSRPKSLKDEINELTHRKKKSFLRREIADTQNILKMTGREPKFPAICAMSLLLFVEMCIRDSRGLCLSGLQGTANGPNSPAPLSNQFLGGSYGYFD